MQYIPSGGHLESELRTSRPADVGEVGIEAESVIPTVPWHASARPGVNHTPLGNWPP